MTELRPWKSYLNNWPMFLHRRDRLRVNLEIARAMVRAEREIRQCGLSKSDDETPPPADCLSARMANDRSPSIAPANPGFGRAWRHPTYGTACGGSGGHSGTNAFRFLALLWLVRTSREEGSQSWRLHHRRTGGNLRRGAEGSRRPDSFLHGGSSGVYQSAPVHEFLSSSAIGNLSRAQPGEVSLCLFQH